MKILTKLATKNSAKFLFKTNPTDQVAISEKLGGRAEWAKNQLRDKTKTALDTLGDLTKLKFFSRENVITLLNTKEAQQNWTRKNGGRPQNSARYVMALQAGLQMLGETPGEVDALYGVKTKSAVLSFQKKYGLKVDGAPGPETIGKMLELLKAEEQKNPAKNKEKEENENDSEKIKKEFTDKAQKLIDQLDGNQKTAWSAALKAILNNFKDSESYRDEWLDDLEKTVVKNSRDLPKKSDKNKEKKEIKSSGKIDWSKHPEFKNKVSEKFMQALLDNKEKLQKELKIPDDLYKDLIALSFAILQLESSGGKNSKHVLFEKYFLDKFNLNNSRGWTQVNLKDKSPETIKLFKKFSIDENDELWDADKAAIATMIVLSQNYKWDRRRYKKNHPKSKLSDFEIMNYLYYDPRGLKKNTIIPPEKNVRIKKAKKYFKIGKKIVNFEEKTFLDGIKYDWSKYKGKNNYAPDGTAYNGPGKNSKGCSSFIIYENREKQPDGSYKYPANGEAWEIPFDIVYSGGWEINNLFKKIKFNKSLKNDSEIQKFLDEKLAGKTVDKSKLKVGDVVSIYYPASKWTSDAYKNAIQYKKEGKTTMPVTHVGQVTEHNGKLYITHNVEGILRSNPLNEFISGKNIYKMKIVGAYRLNSKEARKYLSLKSSKIKPKKSPLEINNEEITTLNIPIIKKLEEIAEIASKREKDLTFDELKQLLPKEFFNNGNLITIDDGPNENTIKILDILDKAGVKAIFYLIGDNIKRYPNHVKEIARRGHICGYHSMKHKYKYSKNELKYDFLEFEKTLNQILGFKYFLVFFRSPGGSQITYKNFELLRRKNQYFKQKISHTNGKNLNTSYNWDIEDNQFIDKKTKKIDLIKKENFYFQKYNNESGKIFLLHQKDGDLKTLEKMLN